MIQLRDYQQDAISKTMVYLKTNPGNPLVVAPTGSGKSLMIAALCKTLEADSHQKKILVLAHRKELLTQNASAISKLNPSASIGFYSSAVGKKNLTADIIVAGIASISRADVNKLPQFAYIIIDEAHLVNSLDVGQYRTLIAAFPEARVIGFSATPFRLKGGFLHKSPDSIFADIAVDIPIVKLMEEGYLSPLTSKSSAVKVDLDGLHTRGGEFIQAEYDAKFNDDELIEHTVEDIIKHAGDRQSILIFCSSIDHAEKVNACLIRNNITSLTITGKTPGPERDTIIKLFKERRITAITNCDVLTVGFDAPNVDVIVLLRPTKSCGLYIQIVGRGTRLYGGKKNCMVLDYGGNIERFGPIDQIRLKQNSFGRVEAEEINLKVCPECRECISLRDKICPSCSYIYPVREVERKTKHDYKASNLDILKASLMRQKFDGVQILQVYDHKFAIHNKPGKPTSVRVDYYISQFDKVSEWICIEHQGFALSKAKQWWNKHSNGQHFPKTCKEMIDVKDLLILPDKIIVELQSNYPVITTRYFPTPKILITSQMQQFKTNQSGYDAQPIS